MSYQSTDIFIIGAGPTGLMLASQLSLHANVSFHIVDKNARAANQSRALVVHARSLELFAQLNLVDKALARGRYAKSMNLFFNGQLSLKLDLSKIQHDNTVASSYSYVLFLEQPVTEDLLETYLNEHGFQVERNVEVQRMEENDDGRIRVTLSNGNVVVTKYVCACDGAHSFVRQQLKVPFSGRTYSSSLFLADCQVNNCPLNTDEAGVFYSSSGMVGLFPLSKTRMRIVGTIEDHPDRKSISIEEVGEFARQRTFTSMTVEDCRWSAIYRSHHRHVDQFRVNQHYFFLGDAAHIHSPVGGQGMNTGLQDAHNLAWKLAFRLNCNGTEALLDTYHDERHQVAEMLVSSTDRIFSWISSQNFWVRLFLNQFVSRILRWFIQPWYNRSAKLRRNFFNRISQLTIFYSSVNTSPSSDGYFPANIPKPGERFPYAWFDARFYHFISFENKDNKKIEDFLQAAKQKYPALILVDYARDRMLPMFYPGVFLVRPDGFIAYRTTRYNFEHFTTYFSKFFA